MQQLVPIGRSTTRRRTHAAALILALLALVQVGSVCRADTHVVEAPPLKPEEQIKRFRLPPGFTIQLVAAEPEVRKPINLAFDDSGRLLVTGSIEYPFPAADPKQARDVVTRLEIGSDGRATSHRAVVTGLNIPIGVASIADELLVYGIPHVLRCRDDDGDGVFEQKRPIIHGFGFRDTHGMVNGLTPWIDGWIYSCHGFANESTAETSDGLKLAMQSGNTFRWTPDGSNIRQFTHGQVNPFGLAPDEWGHFFSADCHTLPAYQLLEGAYYPSFGKPHDGLGFGPPIMKHAHGSTGIAGIVYYEADHFPKEYRRTLFIGNPITGRINHDRLERSGASYRAVEQPDFLTCDDPWFRPVDVKLGPDGALYVADFYNCIIGHYEVPLDHPKRDRERGRIWRIVYAGDDTKPATMPNLRQASFEQLLRRLGDPNTTVRTSAVERLVARRSDPAHREVLLRLIDDQTKPAIARACALWVVERCSATPLAADAFVGLFDDAEPLVRVHAVKVFAGRKIDGYAKEYWDALRRRLRDKEPFVVLAAAEALAQHPAKENVGELLDAWRRTPKKDAQLTHALRMALRNQFLGDLQIAGFVDRRRTRDERTKLADIALGLPLESAAAYVLSELGEPDSPQRSDGRYIEYVARWSAENRLPVLYGIGAGITDVERRLVFYRGASAGLTAAGRKIPEEVRNALMEIAEKFLTADDEPTCKRGLELVRDLRSPRLYDAVLPHAARKPRFAALRVVGLEAIAAADAERSTNLLIEVLDDPTEPADVQVRVAQLLAGLDRPVPQTALLKRAATASERLTREIAAGLAQSATGAEALLGAIAAGKITPRVLQEPIVFIRLDKSKPQKYAERIAELTKNLPPADERIKTLLGARSASFAKAQTDATRGEAVFTKSCAACHRLAGRGNKIGPELEGVGRRGLERLLEDVLDPNRTIDQAFRATQFTLVDGRILTGLVVRREGDVTVVADAQGKEVRLPKSEIDEQTVLAISPMPANWAETLPESDFHDLMAYLLRQSQAAAASGTTGGP